MQRYTVYFIWRTALDVSGGGTPTATAAGSSNGVTNTRCYRYSYLRSGWWVVVPPEICRAVLQIKWNV